MKAHEREIFQEAANEVRQGERNFPGFETMENICDHSVFDFSL